MPRRRTRRSEVICNAVFEALEGRTLLAADTGLIDVQFGSGPTTNQTGTAVVGESTDTWNNINIYGYGTNPYSNNINSATIPNVDPSVSGGAPVYLNNTSNQFTGVTLNVTADDFTPTYPSFSSLSGESTEYSPLRYTNDATVMSSGMESGPGVTVTLGGLTPGTHYNVYLLSENGIGEDSPSSTKFTLSNPNNGESQIVEDDATVGDGTSSYEPGVNYASFQDVVVDSSGQVSIDVQGTGDTRSDGYYYQGGILNGIQLQPVVNINVSQTKDTYTAGDTETINVSVSRAALDPITDPVTTTFSLGSYSDSYTLATPYDYSEDLFYTSPGDYRYSVVDAYDGVNYNGVFNVVPGPAAQLVFSQQPTDVAVNSTISPPIAVTVLDGYGNVVDDGSSITLTLSGGMGSFGPFGSTTVTEQETGGTAYFGSLSIDTPGTYTLSASDPDIASSFDSDPFNVTAANTGTGPLLNLQFTDNTSVQTGGGVLSLPDVGDWNNIDLSTYPESSASQSISGTQSALQYSDGSNADGVSVSFSGDSPTTSSGSYPYLVDAALLGSSGNITVSGLSGTAQYSVVVYSGYSSATFQLNGGATDSTSDQNAPVFGPFTYIYYDQEDNVSAPGGQLSIDFSGQISGIQILQTSSSSASDSLYFPPLNGRYVTSNGMTTQDDNFVAGQTEYYQNQVQILDGSGNILTSDNSSQIMSEVLDSSGNLVSGSESSETAYQGEFTVPIFTPTAGAYTLHIVDSTDGLTLDVPITATDQPHLTISNIVTSGNFVPGGSVTVSYTEDNDGSADATGTWLDQYDLFSDESYYGLTGANETMTGVVQPGGTVPTIPAGGSVPQFITITLPDSFVDPSGNIDPANSLYIGIFADVPDYSSGYLVRLDNGGLGNINVGYDYDSYGASQAANQVTTATPTLTVNPDGDSYVGGLALTDSATLSGGNAEKGTLTFTAYNLNISNTTPVFIDTINVIGDGTYTSDGYSPMTSGTYQWVVSYSGDANNNAVSDGTPGDYSTYNSNNVENVGKGTPKVSVTAPDSVYTSNSYASAVGSALDVGNDAITDGSFDYLYETSISGPTTHTAPTAAGSYFVIAEFSGDADYVAQDSAPTPFTISSAGTTVTPADASIHYLDRSVSLSAAVSSSTSALVNEGYVEFTFIDSDDPSLQLSVRSTTVADGQASADLELPVLPAGTYTVEASYFDDAVFPNFQDSSPADATLTINPLGTTLTASDSKTTYGIGLVSVSVASSDGHDLNEGSVTFYFPDLPDADNTFTADVIDGTATAPVPFDVGTYAFQASYHDPLGNFADSNTASANVEVDPQSPNINIGNVGADFGSDTVSTVTVHVFTPSVTLSGTITYTILDCHGNPVDGTPTTVTAHLDSYGNQRLPLPGTGSLPIGTYNLEAYFTPSDPNYTTSNTSTATLTVVAATPTIQISNADGGAYTGNPYAATATVNGNATLEGVGLTITYYSGSYDDPSELLAGGGSSEAPTDVGDYTVVATYPGSSPHYTSATELANFTISVLTTGLDVTAGTFDYTDSPQSDPVVSATVTGGANSTGTVTFEVSDKPDFSDGYSSFAVNLAAPDNGVASVTLALDAAGITEVGTYYVRAFYSGDNNNLGSASATEALVIQPVTPDISLPDATAVFSDDPAIAAQLPTTTITATVLADGKPVSNLDGSGEESVTFYIAPVDDPDEVVGKIVAVGADGTASINSSDIPVLFDEADYDPFQPGSYTISAIYSGNNSGYSPNIATASLTFNYGAIATVSDSSGAYTGQPYAASATVNNLSDLSGIGGSLSYTYYPGTYSNVSNLTGLTGSPDAPVNTGDYTVLASYSGNGSYEAASALANFSITPAPLTLTAENTTAHYGTHPFSFTIDTDGFVNNEGFDNLTGSLSVSTDATSSSLPGIYAITVGGVSSTNYDITFVPGTLTIIPATPAMTFNGVNVNLTYTGQPYAQPAVNLLDVNGNPLTDEPVTFLYAAQDGHGGLTSFTSTVPTAAGDYVVRASYPGDGTDAGAGNYGPGWIEQPFHILPAPLTITAEDQTITYGSTIPTLMVKYDGFVNGEDAAALTTLPAVQLPDGFSGSVGSYTLTPSGAAAANYMITYQTGTLTVDPATPTLFFNSAAGLDATYTGKSYVQPPATVLGVNGNSLTDETVSYQYAVQPADGSVPVFASTVPTAAGAYLVQAAYPGDGTDAGAGNYGPGSITVPFTISPVPLIISADNKTITYGSAVPNLTVTYNSFVNNETSSVLSVLPAVQLPSPFSGDAGAYTLIVSGAAAANYSITYQTGTLTINPFQPSISFSNTSFTYDGNSHSPTATATGVNGAKLTPVSYTYYSGTTVNGATKLTGGAPTHAGTYTVVAMYNGSTDYAPVGSQTTFTIAKANPAVTWAAPSPIQYGTPLSGTQLDAQANVGGTFVYTPTFGVILLPGNNQPLQAVFTPSDTTDYNSTPAGQSITVVPPANSINADSITRITRGTGAGTYMRAVSIATSSGSHTYVLSGLQSGITVSVSGGGATASYVNGSWVISFSGSSITFTLTFADPNAAAPSYSYIFQ